VTACALMILGLSFFLATASVRIAAKPLRHLVERIQTLNPQAANATEQTILDTGVYKETELQAICSALNGFLQRLQEALAREKNWMALASHEFRTPLAVISGAVSVIQQRGQLQPDDEKTLARIASASTDMSQYVNASLTLIRQKNSGPVEQIDLVAVYQELASSYAWKIHTGPTDSRSTAPQHPSSGAMPPSPKLHCTTCCTTP
jgi:signal transduction histidine kinase